MRYGIRASGALTIVTLSILAPAAAAAAAVPATVATASASAATSAAAAASAAASTSTYEITVSALDSTPLAPTQFAQNAQNSQDGPLVVEEMPKGGVNLRDLAPGDRTQWAAEVTNNGDPGMLAVDFLADGHGSLMSGGETSLRITVDLCPTKLTALVSETGVTTFDCSSGMHRLGTVTSATKHGLRTARSLDTGESVGVRVLVAFPSSADNSSEDSAASMNVVFSLSPDAVAGGDSDSAQRVLPGGLALTGTNIMFLPLAAGAIISLGILLMSLAPRRTRTEGDDTT
jgi:hypothetical protein